MMYSWSPAPRGAFSVYSFIGKIYIKDKPAILKRLELLPYVSLELNKASEESPESGGRTGFLGRYYFSQNCILDFTLVPDFSQIETDAPQIDVNTTFALYYPEKRPFFLEGKSVFKTPFEIFYTRTINDPVVALKFTGGIKDFDIGYVSALDMHTLWVLPFAEKSLTVESDRKSLTNVLRTKKAFKKGNYTGFLLTEREEFDGRNLVSGIDGNLFLPFNFSFNYQGVFSYTREPSDTTLFSGFDGEVFSGYGFSAELVHQNRYFGLRGLYQGLSPGFRADNGFIMYNDFEKRRISGVFFIRPHRYFLETITPGFEFTEDRRFLSRRVGREREVSLKTEFSYNMVVYLNYRLKDKEYKGVYFEKMRSIYGSFSMPLGKYFSVNMGLRYGDEINYYAIPPELGKVIYPFFEIDFGLGRFSLKGSYNRYILESKEGKRVYDARTFSAELRFIFTDYLNFRLWGTYSSSTNTVLFSPLLAFEFSPFTVFYLGANYNIYKQEENEGKVSCSIFLSSDYLF